MSNINNHINHICPCCKYQTEWCWDENKFLNVKGDEPFIIIINTLDDTHKFKTDKQKPVHTVGWMPITEAGKVVLLGCPKCGCVSYKFD